jgi:hypothetical protein
MIHCVDGDDLFARWYASSREFEYDRLKHPPLSTRNLPFFDTLCTQMGGSQRFQTLLPPPPRPHIHHVTEYI